VEIHVGSLVIVVYAALPAVLFAIWLGIHSRWWKDKLGLALFGQSVAIAVTMLYVVVSNVWPHLPARAELRIFLFTLIGTAFWTMFILLVREQSKARHNPDGFGRRRSDR
jgi:hypothetical protein